MIKSKEFVSTHRKKDGVVRYIDRVELLQEFLEKHDIEYVDLIIVSDTRLLLIYKEKGDE